MMGLCWPCCDPDNMIAAVARNSNNIYIINADTGEEIRKFPVIDPTDPDDPANDMETPYKLKACRW